MPVQEHVQADGRIQRTEVMLPPLLPPNSWVGVRLLTSHKYLGT